MILFYKFKDELYCIVFYLYFTCMLISLHVSPKLIVVLCSSNNLKDFSC